jgi:hypothetical protein
MLDGRDPKDEHDASNGFRSAKARGARVRGQQVVQWSATGPVVDRLPAPALRRSGYKIATASISTSHSGLISCACTAVEAG